MLKKLLLTLSLVLPIELLAANYSLGAIEAGFNYHETYNYDQSDYVSEENIASDTLYFNLTDTYSITFYADNFNFNSSVMEFRQIDILDVDKTVFGMHDNNWIASVGDYYKGLDGGDPVLTYTLGPGNYQINYKSTGLEQAFNSTRVVGSAVTGLGSYDLGLSVAAVPEPEEYVLLLAGLCLVGFASNRGKTVNSAPHP